MASAPPHVEDFFHGLLGTAYRVTTAYGVAFRVYPGKRTGGARHEQGM